MQSNQATDSFIIGLPVILGSQLIWSNRSVAGRANVLEIWCWFSMRLRNAFWKGFGVICGAVLGDFLVPKR